MEELDQFCKLGTPVVAIDNNWEYKDEAIGKLLECGYAQICQEDEDEQLLFVYVIRPPDLNSLREACGTGKDLIIRSALWEDPEAQIALKSHHYVESQLITQEETAGLLHFTLGSVESEKIFCDLVPYHASASRQAPEEEWKACQSFQLDSSMLEQNDQEKYAIKACSDQSVCVKLMVEPYAKLDEFHLHLKLHVSNLQVGVLRTKFCAVKNRLGAFPDWIKLSFKPNWADMSVPKFLSSAGDGNYGLGLQRETEYQVGAGVSQGPVSVNVTRTCRTRSTEYCESLDELQEEKGGAAFEWSLQRWKNGKKYRKSLWFSPQLPFRGTGPALRNLTDIAWILPIDRRFDGLEIEVHLEFQMQYVEYVELFGQFVKSPRWNGQNFHFVYRLPITLPTLVYNLALPTLTS